MRSLYLVGAGGHCRSCIDVIEATGLYKIEGLFDIQENVGKRIGDYSVLGTDQEIEKYISAENEFLVTLGQIKSAEKRIQTVRFLKDLGAQFATVVSPRAYVSSTAMISSGTIVMHDVVVNAYSKVGAHCILNTKSLVEHDAQIENFCHVSTGAIVNGGASLGQGSFLGSLATLKEGYVGKQNAVLSAGVFHR